MFERMRSDQVKRLGALMNRFEALSSRAHELNEEASTGVRLGLGAGAETAAVAAEVCEKALEQAGVCGESISLLLVERSSPLIFRRGLSKAEAFADQCELILGQIDDGRRAGREAFQQRFGMSRPV